MADAFIHIPALRDRLIAPETSKARVTEAVLAQWDARVKALGGDADWRLADDVREASRQTVLQSFDQAADLWVFAYGSLMWDPAIHFAEVRRASLSGFKRCFNYQVLAGRGTPQAPGLVLSLVPANAVDCQGLAFRIARDAVETESVLLWRREMLRGGYTPSRHLLQTPQGECEGLVFVGNPTHVSYCNDLTAEQTAEVIARAEGYLGPNRDYLLLLAAQLAALEIEDPYIADLHTRVLSRVSQADTPHKR